MGKATLVIMAAGIGSRFGGGIKQLEPVGPNGEIIMDYSIYDAMEAAKARNADLVIVDTAGRLHTKVNLMEELKKMGRVANNHVEGAPHQTLLVLDGTTGQNAVSQAKLFGQAVPVNGIVVTKLDGTAKGGVVISIKEELGVPVRWIGVGEGMDDLRPFNAKEFANALFNKGMIQGDK